MADIEPVTPARAQPVVVTLPREIDMTNACQVSHRLCAALSAGAPIVVADMTATRFCDSMGLRALVLAHKQASASSAEFRVAVASANVLKVMAITQLDTVLHIYPSTEEALANGTG